MTCDARLESSVEGIFAAGDVCSYESQVHGRRLRVEGTAVRRSVIERSVAEWPTAGGPGPPERPGPWRRGHGRIDVICTDS